MAAIVCRDPKCGCIANHDKEHPLKLITSECSICLCAYKDDLEARHFTDIVVSRHCGHVFHVKCLTAFVESTGAAIASDPSAHDPNILLVSPQPLNRPRPNCPLCRRALWGVFQFRLRTSEAPSKEKQCENMLLLLHQGRQRCLDQGVPEQRIIYVLRNNADEDGVFDRAGNFFTTLQDAEQECRMVLQCSFVYPWNLYDVHVLDGALHEQVCDLLCDVKPEDLREYTGQVSNSSVEASS